VIGYRVCALANTLINRVNVNLFGTKGRPSSTLAVSSTRVPDTNSLGFRGILGAVHILKFCYDLLSLEDSGVFRKSKGVPEIKKIDN
jgi:hypothetical protein